MRGLHHLDGVDGTEATIWRARTLSLLGGMRNRQGRSLRAIPVCRRAIEQAESVGELRALAHAYHNLDWALLESGRSQEPTYSWEALRIFEELGDPEHEFVVLNNLGMFAYWADRWDDAVELYTRAGQASERAGMPANRAFTDGNVGEILSDQGHLDEAEAHLQRARRTWTATGDVQNVAFADALLARLTVRRGRYGEGLEMLEAASESLRRLKLAPYVEFTEAAIVEAEAFAGDARRALDIASRELQDSDRQRPMLTRLAGIALARLGQTEAAVRELTQSLRSARERRSDYDIAATIDALDGLGAADPEAVEQRDEIVARLRIVRLPTPASD
jgi:tetratricopeptide (TPR) repeat protein